MRVESKPLLNHLVCEDGVGVVVHGSIVLGKHVVLLLHRSDADETVDERGHERVGLSLCDRLLVHRLGNRFLTEVKPTQIVVVVESALIRITMR